MTSTSPLEIKRVYSLSEKQVDDYIALALLCQDEFNLPRAAARCLRQLVTEWVYVMPGLAWLDKAEAERSESVAAGDPLFPHLPATLWKLICKID